MPLAALVLAVALILAGCHPLGPDLDEYCPEYPTRERCPGKTLCPPYECVAYCIEHHSLGEAVPATGMGSWCDDDRLPESYVVFCRDHGEVQGCDGCLDDPSTCGGCEPEGCFDVATSLCDSGICRACAADDDCRHLPATPACHLGVCRECREGEIGACRDATPHCDEGEQSCVECLEDAHCDDGIACSADSCVDHACLFDLDGDDDGASCDVDCDDEDPTVFPGAAELCDGLDNDCDGAPEEDFDVVLDSVRVSEIDAVPMECAVAAGGGVTAVAWCDSSAPFEDAPRLAIVDGDGVVLSRTTLAAPGLGCWSAAIVWTGEDFVVAWIDGVTGSHMVAASPEGELTSEVSAIAEGMGYVHLAHAGGDLLAVAWEEDGDATVALFSGDLSDGEGRQIASVPDCDLDAELAATDDGRLLLACSTFPVGSTRAFVVPVSDDEGEGETVELAAGVDPINVSATSIGDTFVVAFAEWRHDEVWVARFDGEGALLDTGIVGNASPMGLRDVTAVAVSRSNGRGGPPGAGLAIAGPAPGGSNLIVASRLGVEGGLGDEPVELAWIEESTEYPRGALALARTASGFAVAYRDSAVGLVGLTTLETCF